MFDRVRDNYLALIEKNQYEEALNIVMPYAGSGDDEGQLTVGYIYNRAHSYYKNSDKQGYAPSTRMLGYSITLATGLTGITDRLSSIFRERTMEKKDLSASWTSSSERC